MSKKKHRAFTAEFRREALELLQTSGKSMTQIEKGLGITSGLLGKWLARYQVVSQGQAGKSLAPSESEAAQREIRRLQRELMEVTEEREILKKVVSIFSRKSA
jgi:transposase